MDPGFSQIANPYSQIDEKLAFWMYFQMFKQPFDRRRVHEVCVIPGDTVGLFVDPQGQKEKYETMSQLEADNRVKRDRVFLQRRFHFRRGADFPQLSLFGWHDVRRRHQCSPSVLTPSSG